MTNMQEFFDRKADLTPNNARLVAIEADCFWNDLSTARTTLFPVDSLVSSIRISPFMMHYDDFRAAAVVSIVPP